MINQTAAALVCAVSDRNHTDARTVLRDLSKSELRDLATWLAGHVDPDRPFTPRALGADRATEECLTRAAAMFDTTVAAMKSGSRRPEHVRPRHVAIYAARLCGASFPQIGRAFGQHHTTVMYAVSRVGENPGMRRLAHELAEQVGRRDFNDVPDFHEDADEARADRGVVERILSGYRVDGSTHAEREEVLRRWPATGRSWRELERVTGWNVHRLLRETTKPPRPERVYERITLDVDQVAADYAAGMTLQQIADKNGVSHPVIARHLDQAGVARRKQRFAYTAEFLDQVRDLYENNGLSQAKIADRLGLTQKVIQSAMVKAGVRPRLDAVGLSRAGLGGHDIKLNAEQRAEIVTRYQAGESGPRLAETYGISSVAVYQTLKRAGVERRRS